MPCAGLISRVFAAPPRVASGASQRDVGCGVHTDIRHLKHVRCIDFLGSWPHLSPPPRRNRYAPTDIGVCHGWSDAVQERSASSTPCFARCARPRRCGNGQRNGRRSRTRSGAGGIGCGRPHDAAPHDASHRHYPEHLLHAISVAATLLLVGWSSPTHGWQYVVYQPRRVCSVSLMARRRHP